MRPRYFLKGFFLFMVNIIKIRQRYNVLKDLHSLYTSLLESEHEDFGFIQIVFHKFKTYEKFSIGYNDEDLFFAKTFIDFDKFCLYYYGYKKPINKHENNVSLLELHKLKDKMRLEVDNIINKK